MTNNYTIDPDTFESYWSAASSRAYSTCTELFLFGILVVLLAIAAHLLHHRNHTGQRVLVAATVAMGVLGTFQLVLQVQSTVLMFQRFHRTVEDETWLTSSAARKAGDLSAMIDMLEDFALVINNVVTDGLFIYRCYIIWDGDIRVVVAPIFAVLATIAVGLLAAYEGDWNYQHIIIDGRIVYGIVIATNVGLMALTAGRIWWIRRKIAGLVESSATRVYDTVIAIILESGAIYCITIVLYVISISLSDLGTDSLTSYIIRAALPQVMNIAPTLIIVRVGLGRSVEHLSSSNRRTPKPLVWEDPVREVSTENARVANSIVVIDIHAAHHEDEDEEAEGKLAV